MNTITVLVKDLLVGDYLPATKRTVTTAPYAGLRTPSGKRDLGLRRDGQSVSYLNTWGARTKISVIRNA